jgi:hypothetical protein
VIESVWQRGTLDVVVANAASVWWAAQLAAPRVRDAA